MISFLPGISFHSFNTPITSLLISIVCIVSYGFVLFFYIFPYLFVQIYESVRNFKYIRNE